MSAMELRDLGTIVDMVARDARRYRWLRDPANSQHPAWDVIGSTESTEEQIDAAIDAAIEEMTR